MLKCMSGVSNTEPFKIDKKPYILFLFRRVALSQYANAQVKTIKNVIGASFIRIATTRKWNVPSQEHFNVYAASISTCTLLFLLRRYCTVTRINIRHWIACAGTLHKCDWNHSSLKTAQTKPNPKPKAIGGGRCLNPSASHVHEDTGIEAPTDGAHWCHYGLRFASPWRQHHLKEEGSGKYITPIRIPTCALIHSAVGRALCTFRSGERVSGSNLGAAASMELFVAMSFPWRIWRRWDLGVPGIAHSRVLKIP